MQSAWNVSLILPYQNVADLNILFQINVVHLFIVHLLKQEMVMARKKINDVQFTL